MKNIMEFMNTQHGEMDQIFKKFRKTKMVDFKKSRQYFSEFKTLLEKHMGIENDVIFPYIEKALGNETINNILKHEHVQISKLVSDINERLDRGDTQTGDLEYSLELVLNWHAVKEEGTIYQLIDQISERDLA